MSHIFGTEMLYRYEVWQKSHKSSIRLKIILARVTTEVWYMDQNISVHSDYITNEFIGNVHT